MKFEDFMTDKDNKNVNAIKTDTHKTRKEQEMEIKEAKEKLTRENSYILEKPRPAEQDFSLYTQNNFYDTNMNFPVLQQNLGNCLKIIDDEVMKGYINNLSNLSIVEPDSGIIASLKDIMFFKIKGIVYQEDEFSVHKLSTMFHSLSNKPCTLVLMIRSDGNSNDFYLGVRSLDKKYSTGTMLQMLKQGLAGMFPGSSIDSYYDEDLKKDMSLLNPGCVSSVTCIADFKQNEDRMDNKKFIQGLEKFVDSMQKKPYTAIFIAENLSHNELMGIKNEYENIYTQISPFANMQLNFTSSNSNSASSGQSNGITQSTSYSVSDGISNNAGSAFTTTTGTNSGYGSTDSSGTNDSVSDGRSETHGETDGTSSSVSDGVTNGVNINLSGGTSIGANAGASLGGKKIFGVTAGVFGSVMSGLGAGVSHSKTHTNTTGTSHSVSKSDSISKTLSHGISSSHSDSVTYGINESKGITHNIGYGTQHSDNYSTGESFNLVDSKTLTDTFGTSQGVTLNAKNMTLQSMLQRLEKHLKRIDECESAGMWNFAAYFMGESAAETETAANTYQSVVSGTESGIERPAVNTWTRPEDLESVTKYVKNFMHPCFIYNGFDYDGLRQVIVNPAVMVSTTELAIHMGLPRHSVKGLPVIKHATFAQEVLRKNLKEERKFNLGKIYHLGEETNTKVELDVESLAMHTFITGSTGSGKSNAVYHLLSEAENKKIPFLVVEPAKGEYKKVFPNVNCFGTNPNIGEIIRINPFSFPGEIHVLEHIDRIIEIFNVCWPMYAAMPAVLKESVEKAYISAGWDMDLSVNTKIPGLYPTFDDVVRELNDTINTSAYSEDTKGDYIGSLSTRLKSLTNGINGRIFVGNEMDLEKLFDESAILDISRVGSMETKALIMGLIVLKLQEYRMANADGMNSALKHITILEEAHNLLKKTSTEQSQDSANMQGKSVEMLTNAIAEIRTYGEGFVIVDQAPDLLDTAVIRNTNTKIVLRLPEGNDRKITGASMALSEKQVLEISKLPTGVAAVYQNDWQEAVLCKLPHYKQSTVYEDIKPKENTITLKNNNFLLHELLKEDYSADELEKIRKDILECNVSASIRKDLIFNIEEKNIVFEWAMADFINKNYRISDVFRGTDDGQWSSLKELGGIMSANVAGEFTGFDNKEMVKILYYICRVMQERFPENNIIEQLRSGYLKKEMVR
ncbi:MAG: DUF87 domain-containing protein [Lachnospiraceae bacterium]|nr:DUF87 domain-containing protein [Lachnospiraceae bacterium]